MRRERGFTLTELAVVLVIVGFLLGGMMFTYSVQVDQSNRLESQRRLELARELLIAYAIVNGRLPCPAAPPNTTATTTADEVPEGGGSCTYSYTGYVPGKVIGFAPVNAAGYASDAWGNPIRYSVAKDSATTANAYPFTTSGLIKSNGISLLPNDLVVCGRSLDSRDPTSSPPLTQPSCGNSGDNPIYLTNQKVVVAVVWTTGKNTGQDTSGRAEENTNNKTETPNNKHGLFMYRSPTDAASPLGEFDDQIVWLPASQLYARMISAGVLP